MRKIIFLLILFFNVFSGNLGPRGGEAAFGESGSKRVFREKTELNECPFGITKIIFPGSDDAPGTLPEEITDQNSIKRLCELSELINSTCRFAQAQQKNEIEIRNFPKHLSETVLRIERAPDNLEAILTDLEYDIENINELMFFCYYFKIKSNVVKVIATYIANNKEQFLAYLKFIKDLPNEDLFDFFISNVNRLDLQKSDRFFVECKVEGRFRDSLFSVSLDGRYFVGVNNIDNSIYLVDLNDCVSKKVIDGNFKKAFISPNGKYVIGLLSTNYIQIINLSDNKIITVTDQFGGDDISLNDKYLIGKGPTQNNTMIVVDLADVESCIYGAEKYIVSPDGKYVVFIHDYKLDVLNLETNMLSPVAGTFYAFASQIKISPDSRYLIAIENPAGPKNRKLIIFDLLQKKQKHIPFPGDSLSIEIHISQDSRYIFLGSSPNVASILNRVLSPYALTSFNEKREISVIDLNDFNKSSEKNIMKMEKITGEFLGLGLGKGYLALVEIDGLVKKLLIVDLNDLKNATNLADYIKHEAYSVDISNYFSWFRDRFNLSPESKYIIMRAGPDCLSRPFLIIDSQAKNVEELETSTFFYPEFIDDNHVLMRDLEVVAQQPMGIQRQPQYDALIIDLRSLEEVKTFKNFAFNKFAKNGNFVVGAFDENYTVFTTKGSKFLDFISDYCKDQDIFNLSLLNQIVVAMKKYKGLFSENLVSELEDLVNFYSYVQLASNYDQS